MYAPAQDDEITGLVRYLDQQLAAIRASAYGLTEQQARETPCRSALSIGGIIKHTTHGMRGAVERLTTEVTEQPVDEAALAAFMDGFTVREDETVAATTAEFDRARAELLATTATTDPARETVAPPGPWHGIADARPVRARYHLVHLIEEWARQAGHADIVRGQIDGVAVPALVMTLEGMSPNDFFRPYRPATGTLLT